MHLLIILFEKLAACDAVDISFYRLVMQTAFAIGATHTKLSE